jgi:hypothetical protein
MSERFDVLVASANSFRQADPFAPFAPLIVSWMLLMYAGPFGSPTAMARVCVAWFGRLPLVRVLVKGANGGRTGGERGRTGQPDGSCWRKRPNRQSALTCSRLSHF